MRKSLVLTAFILLAGVLVAKFYVSKTFEHYVDLLKEGDPATAPQAGVILSHMGAEALEPAIEAFRSEDPLVRREALRTIAKLRTRGPVDYRLILPLLMEGLEDEDAGVRAVAAAYVGNIRKDPETSVPAMVHCLDDSDSLVRANCARSLGRFYADAEPAVPALVKALYDDPSTSVRFQASIALDTFPEARRNAAREAPDLTAEEAETAAKALGIYPSEDALYEAVTNGDIAGVRLLLAAGMDPNAKWKKAVITPLFRARHSDIVMQLIRAGANVNHTTTIGETPLLRAVHVGDPESVRLLLAAGARTDARLINGDTAGSIASSRKGHQGEAVRAILREAGVPVP